MTDGTQILRPPHGKYGKIIYQSEQNKAPTASTGGHFIDTRPGSLLVGEFVLKEVAVFHLNEIDNLRAILDGDLDQRWIGSGG